MKPDWQIEDQIHEYISGEMDADERTAFEKLLSEDKVLNDKVMNEQQIKLNIKRYHRSKIKKQLQEIHKTTINKKSNSKIYILLGAVILLMLLSFWYLSKKETFTHQELYAKYYTKYTIEEDQRNGGEEKLNDIFIHYKNESFDIVINQTEEFSMKSIPSSYRLLLGISYLELNKLERAKFTFQSIIDEQDVIFIDQALWYLALTELKSNNIEIVKNLLNKIMTDSSSDHYENANNLLESLN